MSPLPIPWCHVIKYFLNFVVHFVVTEGETCCIPIFVRKTQFRLPFKSVTPVVMVGPGTGFAPFRGFIQDRHIQKSSGQSFTTIIIASSLFHNKIDSIIIFAYILYYWATTPVYVSMITFQCTGHSNLIKCAGYDKLSSVTFPFFT